MQKLLSRLSVLIFILSLTIQPINIFAQEETEKSDESEDIEDIEDKDNQSGPSLKKCLMKAKSMKDKKNCQKKNMKTVEEFIEDDVLELIE